MTILPTTKIAYISKATLSLWAALGNSGQKSEEAAFEMWTTPQVDDGDIMQYGRSHTVNTLICFFTLSRKWSTFGVVRLGCLGKTKERRSCGRGWRQRQHCERAHIVIGLLFIWNGRRSRSPSIAFGQLSLDQVSSVSQSTPKNQRESLMYQIDSFQMRPAHNAVRIVSLAFSRSLWRWSPPPSLLIFYIINLVSHFEVKREFFMVGRWWCITSGLAGRPRRSPKKRSRFTMTPVDSNRFE